MKMRGGPTSKLTKGANGRASSRRTREEIDELVLDCLARSSTPVGAYNIANRLRVDGNPIVPNQVYRTLSRLMEQARVVRLESLSAYVIGREGYDLCLICDDCHSVQFMSDPNAVAQLSNHARALGFKADKTVIEIHGRCPSCVAQVGRIQGGGASTTFSSTTA